MARGFYSVVQYCPDRFRAEAVNVGLVLLCLDPHTVRVMMTNSHERVRRLFGIGRAELKNLKLATHGLKNRIESSDRDFHTAEDLAAFAATRANDLRLTEPRLAKLIDVDSDFERLFAELVEQHSTAELASDSPAEVLPPKLGEVFYRLQQDRKIWKPGTILVPKSKRKLDVPYAYKNGVVNLVLPKVFADSKRAGTQADTLAVSGDLIQRYPSDGEKQKLIVVSTQETPKQTREIDEHVEPLFKEFGVRLIRPQDADAFATEVEQSAH
jgi:hypothetical protein